MSTMDWIEGNRLQTTGGLQTEPRAKDELSA